MFVGGVKVRVLVSRVAPLVVTELTSISVRFSTHLMHASPPPSVAQFSNPSDALCNRFLPSLSTIVKLAPLSRKSLAAVKSPVHIASIIGVKPLRLVELTSAVGKLSSTNLTASWLPLQDAAAWRKVIP